MRSNIKGLAGSIIITATNDSVINSLAPTGYNAVNAIALDQIGGVYLGGTFTTVNNGVSIKALVKVSSSYGAFIDKTFTHNQFPVSISQIKVFGNEVYVIGAFNQAYGSSIFKNIIKYITNNQITSSKDIVFKGVIYGSIPFNIVPQIYRSTLISDKWIVG